jgi:hypothetical protein
VEFRVPAEARTATLLVQGADGKGQERRRRARRWDARPIVDREELGVDGDRYAVNVHAEALSQTDDNTLDFEIYRTNAKEYVRSHNSGVIDGHVYYNAGSHSTPAAADARFEYTSAHEFGHTVLQEAGGTDFSWTHKGSTTIWQAVHDKSPLYPLPPDEIDMMLYFNEDPPSDFYARVHATNADVLRLVSLGEVEIG